MFDRCRRSSAPVALVKYKCDLNNPRGTFARSKILLTEKLTNGILVTPTAVREVSCNKLYFAIVDKLYFPLSICVQFYITHLYNTADRGLWKMITIMKKLLMMIMTKTMITMIISITITTIIITVEWRQRLWNKIETTGYLKSALRDDNLMLTLTNNDPAQQVTTASASILLPIFVQYFRRWVNFPRRVCHMSLSTIMLR